MRMYRIGIDVGGTFTDFTLLDEQSGRDQAGDDTRSMLSKSPLEITKSLDADRLALVGEADQVADDGADRGPAAPTGR